MPMSPRLLRPRDTTKAIPKTIANLVLWLDADDAGSVTEVSGGVSEWRDKSVVARKYTQSFSNNRPIVAANAIGTRRAIRFQGSNDVLASTAAANDLVSPVTLYIVGYKGTNAADGGIFTLTKAAASSFADSSLWCVTTNASSGAFRMFGGDGTSWSGSVSGNAAVVLGNFVFRCEIRNNSNDTAWRNMIDGSNSTDASYTFSSTPNNTGSAIGAITASGEFIHYLTGDIAEVIGYSRALSATEKTTIESYIAAKYGLTLI
jgi:hypothetical protein